MKKMKTVYPPELSVCSVLLSKGGNGSERCFRLEPVFNLLSIPVLRVQLVSFLFLLSSAGSLVKEKQVLNSTWTLRNKVTSMSHERLIFVHPRLKQHAIRVAHFGTCPLSLFSNKFIIRWRRET